MSEKTVSVLSFGYKYGIPDNAGFVIDVRCLPNPYWEEPMRDKCGLDADVDAYVFSEHTALDFLDSAVSMITACLSITKIDEIVVCVGCTGGQHRSVAFAERLGRRLRDSGYGCRTSHREKDRFLPRG